MIDSMAQIRLSLRRDSGVHVVRREELVDASELCALDPVGSVLAASQIVPAYADGVPLGCEILGVWNRGRMQAACWSGANLVPVNCDARAAVALAHYVRRQGRRCSSIVGEATTVATLWEALKDAWPGPREIRSRQLSMATSSNPVTPTDPEVRLTRPDEFGLVFPACVSMFTEEVGYSPLLHGGGPGYASRVHNLIAQGRSFVRIAQTAQGPQVVFKAEVGATALGVAQIQGVWIHPKYRGRGMSAGALAAVVRYTRANIAEKVSLYVNDFNRSAIAAYQRVGFLQVGTFTTILF